MNKPFNTLPKAEIEKEVEQWNRDTSSLTRKLHKYQEA